MTTLARDEIVSARRRSGGRLLRIDLREPHLVLRRGGLGRRRLGFDRPGRFALARRRVGGGRDGGEAAAVLAEFRMVLAHDAIGFVDIDRADRFGRWNVQDASGAHEIHVLADEGILVRAVDRDQHLVERDARRQVCLGDGVEAATSSVVWIERVNVTVSGDVLQKTGGCDGCPDAFAVSEGQISTDGRVEFTPLETSAFRFVGLGSASLKKSRSIVPPTK